LGCIVRCLMSCSNYTIGAVRQIGVNAGLP
jgi:putative component of membrane protein insertase Oxa1/YidC/SpoIIIJ protein YidD